MGKIDKKFRSEGIRIISKMGNSLGVTIPKNNLEVSGAGIGKEVEVFFDGESQVLIELKPELVK